MKKHHWHAFWHEKLFEKHLQPHCQTRSSYGAETHLSWWTLGTTRGALASGVVLVNVGGAWF